MKAWDEQGNVLVTVLLAVALTISLVFGVWAYGGRQDYKNNVDQKISAAVSVAKQQESSDKDKQFAEAEKQPLKTYQGPEAYGSLSVSYPKTWSGYVDTSGSNAAVDAYFHPGVVPGVNGNQTQSFALRVQVLNQAYTDTLNQFNQQEGVKISPFALKKVPNVVGVRIDGQIEQDKSGSMVVLPLRDKTIQIYTESNDFLSDFNNNILPNLTFNP